MPIESFGPLHFIEGARKRILNIVSIIAAIESLIFAYVCMDVPAYAFSKLALVGIFVLTILINRFGKITVAEHFITIATTIWIIYMSIAFGSQLGYQNFLIIALVAWSIFSTKKALKFFVIGGLIVLSFVLGLYQRIGTPMFELPAAADFVYVMNVITPLALISVMCWRFVTDTVKAQQTIAEQKEELAESNKFKDRVFSIIGHDMRSPFNSAKGLVDLLDSNMLTAEEKQTVLHELRNNIDVSLQTLDNILGWASQSYYGAILDTKTKPEALSIHSMVEKNIALYSHLASQKNVVFINNTDAETMAAGDLVQILFVIRNLTSNALKFSHPGKAISYATRYEDGELVLSIKDEGIGMSKENVDALFKINSRFSKEGTTNEKGSGLGLIFCKEFVQNNNGKLWIESQQGVGTTVFLSLPKVGEKELVG